MLLSLHTDETTRFHHRLSTLFEAHPSNPLLFLPASRPPLSALRHPGLRELHQILTRCTHAHTLSEIVPLEHISPTPIAVKKTYSQHLRISPPVSHPALTTTPLYAHPSRAPQHNSPPPPVQGTYFPIAARRAPLRTHPNPSSMYTQPCHPAHNLHTPYKPLSSSVTSAYME